MNIETQATTLNTVIALGKTALEIAKRTKDTELKEKLRELQTAILDLTGTVISLQDENRELKAKLAQRGTIMRDARYGYWFKENETEPLCPKCYEGNVLVAYLSPVKKGIRKCNVCESRYSEGGSDGPAISIGHPSITRQARGYWE